MQNLLNIAVFGADLCLLLDVVVSDESGYASKCVM